MPTFYFLSTIDNPFNPATQFDDWYAFDVQKGYNTCALLNRVVESEHESFDKLSYYEQSLVLSDVIDSIVNEDLLGIYMKLKA